MPIYRFIFTGGRSQDDVVSLDLPNPKSAWHEAVTALGDELKAIDGELDIPADLRLTVESAAGRPLFQIDCVTRRCDTP